MMAWYDQREDAALDNSPFIRDPQGGVRHTIDVRAAEGRPGLPPVFSPSIQLSRYLHVLDLDATGNPIEENGYYSAIQAEYNPINYPLFQLGTVPFHGDWLEVTPSVRILPPAIAFGSWIYNINPFDRPVSIRPGRTTAMSGRRMETRGEIGSTTTPRVRSKTVGRTSTVDLFGRLQNGNAESEHLYGQYQQRSHHGFARKHQAARPAADRRGRRTFVVFVKNTSEFERTLNLVIFQIGGVDASFDQFQNDESIQVEVQPYSSVSCTIYVDRSTRKLAPVTVNAFEGLKLVGYVVLNPDPTNLPLSDPDNPFQDLGKETHDPDVSAPRSGTMTWETRATPTPRPSSLRASRIPGSRTTASSTPGFKTRACSTPASRTRASSITKCPIRGFRIPSSPTGP